MKLCPMHVVRPGLPKLTDRIAALPVSESGYPIPFFVAWVDGRPEFRLADPAKQAACVKLRLCWTCGQQLGLYKAFVIGPMCAINRVSGDPPSHVDCAGWSVRGCPFLSRPNMVRREDELTEKNKGNVPGIMIERNPGVSLIWVTKSFKLFPDHAGKPLMEIGEPEEVSWWREGRPATRAEVLESIESGLPLLLAMCEQESTPERQAAARAELVSRRKRVVRDLLPAE